MRPTALFAALLLSPLVAMAGGEIDLTPRSRDRNVAPTWVVRAEGGNAFAPYGYAGACVSYLAGDDFEFEAGAGGGFPGLQTGFAVRRLVGEGAGSHFVLELYLAGNTRVNRGNSDVNLNVAAATAKSSLWTSIGGGFEQRLGNFDMSIAGGLVFTTANATPHFSVHGGLGFGF